MLELESFADDVTDLLAEWDCIFSTGIIFLSFFMLFTM